MKKTWKRETAWFSLVLFWGNVTLLNFGEPNPSIAELLGVISWPVHALAAAMFGIHWYGNLKPKGPA